MINKALTIFTLPFLLLDPLPGQPVQPHPFSVHDMLVMQRISDPQVSPDGSKVIFVLRTTDLEANRGQTDLWVVGLDGTELRQLTTDSASDFNPRWDPNGRDVWFLSTRSGSSQVWELRIDGGEALRATDLPLDVSNLLVSPRGGQLAFTLRVFPDCDSLECTTERLAAEEESQASGLLFRQLFVRHWDNWKDGRRSHLFSMPPDGEPQDLMAGMDADSPSQPFGGPEEIAFSPDGQTLVFTARDAGREEAWSTNFDLYRVAANGSSRAECLTRDNQAWDTAPVFSPDGNTLAYLAMSRPGYESDRFRIVQRDLRQGTSRVLTEAWDRSPGSITWTPDGKAILAVASNLGQSSLFRVDVETGHVQTLIEKGWVGGVVPLGDRILLGMDHLRSPVELYTISAGGGDLRAVTQINAQRVAATRMGETEQFTFSGWNDETVYGYVVKPADFDSRKRYPVAFLIHGGPQGSFGNHFHYRWNPQVYAGAGFAVVMVDFHGSVGYGQAFTDSIRRDWGGKPLEDLKKGLDAALQRYPWMDEDRVGALGASYGGYMVNWIAGNWPDRFRCLVNHDGVFDMRMMYYATEELWFPEWEHGGPYWEVASQHEKHNPANHVEHWKTPMLVIHGGRDYRVLLEQGLGTFTALQRRGIPSEFLYFPDENHWVLTAKNGIQWHETVLAWLNRWLK